MRRLALVLAGLPLLALGLAGPAAAAEKKADADSKGRVVIREIDAVGFPKVHVSLQVFGDGSEPETFAVRENGRRVADLEVARLDEAARQVGVVLAVDVSDAMSASALDEAKQAAKRFVDRRTPNERIAVVSFGAEPRILTRFTDDGARLHRAIDGLVLEPEAFLWDGLRTAAGLYDGQRGLQPNVVVLTAAGDTGSLLTDSGQAEVALLDAKAALHAISLRGESGAPGDLRPLTRHTHGSYAVVGADDVGEALTTVQRTLHNQYQLSYVSNVKDGNLDVAVRADGVEATRWVTAGSSVAGPRTEPEVASEGWTIDFLEGPAGRWLGGLLAMGAVALLVYGVALLVTRDGAALSSFLEPYAEEHAADESSGGTVLAETRLMQRAVQLTTRMAERRGILPKLEIALERADLPLRAGEALFFSMALVVVASALTVVVTKSAIMGLIALLVFGLLPSATVKFLAARRRKKFMSQLPDTLQLLSGSLRAGYSLMQGVEAVSQEVTEPMGRELRRVVAEARLGRPLEESLDSTAERMGSNDFAWAVMAIRIQREVGGNLSELLLTVADTMVARERLRRDVSALTAEGRISAIVLGILPCALGGAMWFINPEYIGVLFDERIGNAMLGSSILLALFGFWWMRKTIQIEV